MITKKKRIGLFGFGCVGSLLYKVLTNQPNSLAEISLICIKQPNKNRSLPDTCFTFNKSDIINNNGIDLVVELIDDADEAYHIVKEALTQGKPVVTANKKMLANHFSELVELAEKNGVVLMYEAAVGGAIPIIRTIEEYYNTDTIESIKGILNGTTNYILSKIYTEGLSYEEALFEAQKLGFAESNPEADVEGFDSKYKLIILVAHAFGVVLKPEQVFAFGISKLAEADCSFALDNSYKIKLVAKAYQTKQGMVSYIIPTFVSEQSQLYHVNNEFNAIEVSASNLDKQWLKGKGAGGLPTAAAVYSDIIALLSNYSYGFEKLKNPKNNNLNVDALIYVYLRYKTDDTFYVTQFESITSSYKSAGLNYITGHIKLSKLLKFNFSKCNNLFLAEITDEHKALPANIEFNTEMAY